MEAELIAGFVYSPVDEHERPRLCTNVLEGLSEKSDPIRCIGSLGLKKKARRKQERKLKKGLHRISVRAKFWAKKGRSAAGGKG